MRRRQGGALLISVIITLALLAAVATLLNNQQGMAASRLALRQSAAAAQHLAEAGLRDGLWRARKGGNIFPFTFSHTLTDIGSYMVTVQRDGTDPSKIHIAARGTAPDNRTASLNRSYTVPCMDGTREPSLFNTYLSDGKPITIFQTPTGNNAAEHLAVDEAPQITNSARGILAFDLSYFATNKITPKIASATLLLNVESHDPAMAGGIMYASRVTRTWNSQHASWTHYDAGANKKWTSPGADFATTDQGMTMILSNVPVNHVYTWDVTDMAINWLNNKTANYGLILRTNKQSSDSNHLLRLKSNKDVWPSAQWPRLEIKWCT